MKSTRSSCCRALGLSFCAHTIAGKMRRKRVAMAAVMMFLTIYVIIYIYLMQNVTATSERLAVMFGGQKYSGDDNYNEDDYRVPNVQIDKVWVAERKVGIRFVCKDVKVDFSKRLYQEALAAADTIDDKVTSTARVLVVGYMRGGTTLFGELFNRQYDHLLWYEPLDSFYMARYGFDVYSNPLSLLYNQKSLPKHSPLNMLQFEQHQQQKNQQKQLNYTRREMSSSERQALNNFLHSLLTCSVKGIPVETFAHPFLYQSSFFRPVYHCLERFNTIIEMIKCKRTSGLAERCSGSDDSSRRRVDIADRKRCADAISLLRSERPVTYNEATRALIQAILPEIDNVDGSESFSEANDSENSTSIGTTQRSLSTTAAMPPSKAFYDHFRCIDDIEIAVGPTCIRPAVAMCSRARLIAVEVVRAAMTDLDAVVARLPDIHVIHYIRDPRAIAVSRAITTRLTFAVGDQTNPGNRKRSSIDDDPLVVESRILCKRMLEDVRARRRLEARYPGAVLVVRYEDLVANPNATVNALFGKVAAPGDDVALDAIHRWLRSVMFAPVSTDSFGVHRTNAHETAAKWTSLINYGQARAMNRVCKRALVELGYEL